MDGELLLKLRPRRQSDFRATYPTIRVARLREQLAFHIDVADRRHILVEKVLHPARAVLQTVIAATVLLSRELRLAVPWVRVASEEPKALVRISRYGRVSAVQFLFTHAVCYQTRSHTLVRIPGFFHESLNTTRVLIIRLSGNHL